MYQCELKSVGVDGMGLTSTTAPLYLSTGGVRGTKLDTSVAVAIEDDRDGDAVTRLRLSRHVARGSSHRVHDWRNRVFAVSLSSKLAGSRSKGVMLDVRSLRVETAKSTLPRDALRRLLISRTSRSRGLRWM
jgi:hypothetical protein